ncbi:carboxypeptidase-like regulatory domain-containing protein [Pontibacter chitinilyticus]|uniref:carboxypeptidase-like regulatory domain-containing protein n=1 Tax=Pontibacter chitinilyticus TaxID=2674989 RepID=UPI00321BB1D1
MLRCVVKSYADKEAVPFAAVGSRSRGTGTTADAKGHFTLSLKSYSSNDTLVFSAVGYQPLSATVQEILSGKDGNGCFGRQPGTNELVVYLKPKPLLLHTVEVKAKHSRWKASQVGYNIGKGSPFVQEFAPTDTLLSSVSGQEIGNNFHFRKYPVRLQDFNFGLHGSGNLSVTVRLHIYSLKGKLPHKKLLQKEIVVNIPPHYTGWIKVPLEKYNILLNQDFAVVLDWVNEANKLNNNSLMTFARMPKSQITFYRASAAASWKSAGI